MKLEFAGDTHVGMKRDHNEDALLILPEENLFVVADGMGGHASGEVASKLAVDTIREFFLDTAQDEEITWPFRSEHEDDYNANRLTTSIKLANLRIFESASADLSNRGMGTTVVSCFATDDKLYVGHVGDSRAYLKRGNELTQLTEDHSLLNDFRRSLNLTPEEEENFPHKNIIVRALGMKDNVEVDLSVFTPQSGDTYLLCSDGLTGELSDGEISLILAEEVSLVKACHRLVKLGNDNGGRDNITVIVLRFLDENYPGADALTEEVTREITDDVTELEQPFSEGEE